MGRLALSILSLGILIGPCAVAGTKAKEKIRISVTRFDQLVDHYYPYCRPWNYWTRQDQLQTELERVLAKEGLKVLERREIHTIYRDELELPNLDKRSRARTNGFLAAQYTITGGITALGICESGNETGAKLGGIVGLLGGPEVDLNVGHEKIVSRVELAAKLLSVETGEVVDSFQAQGEVADETMGGEVGVMGIGVNHTRRARPPIERAANQAIEIIGHQIAKALR